MDFEALDPLDCVYGKRGDLPWRCFSYRTSYSRIPTLHVPSLRWVSIRCEWTCSESFCGFRCPIFSIHVQKARRIWRRDLVRRSKCAVYHRHGLSLYLWCKSQAKEQVCSVMSHDAGSLCTLYVLEKVFPTYNEMRHVTYVCSNFWCARPFWRDELRFTSEGRCWHQALV